MYVGMGDTLIIDSSTPNYLYALICEGNLIFADNQDMTFDAIYLILRHGRLIIGSE